MSEDFIIKMGYQASGAQEAVADINKFNTALDKTEKETKEFGDTTKKTEEFVKGFAATTEKAAQSTEKAGISLKALAAGAAIVTGAVASAAAGLAYLVDRGQGVSELTAAFENLQKNAGNLASNEIQQLTAATDGLLSKTELMAASNQAMLAGLSPEQFRAAAEAADALGDAVGVNTKQALDDLATALTTGNERLLKTYGILVDNKKAEEDYAKSIGTTANLLNEDGKRAAGRIAILAKLKETTAQLGEGSKTAGDGVQRIGVALTDLINDVAKAVNENKELAAALDDVAKAIKDIDPAVFVSAMNSIVNAAALGIRAIAGVTSTLAEAADRAFNLSSGEQLREIEISISGKVRELEKQKKNLEGFQQTIDAFKKQNADPGRFQEGFDTASDKVKNLEGELRNYYLQRAAIVAQSPEFQRTQKAVAEGASLLVDKFNGLWNGTKDVKAGMIDEAKASELAKKAAEEHAKKAAELLKKQLELADSVAKATHEYQQFNRELETTKLEDSITKAIEKGDVGTFKSLLGPYRKALEESTREALIEKFPTVPLANAIGTIGDTIEPLVKESVTPAIDELTKDMQEKLKDTFQASVDFFGDLLTPMFEGEASNFEDIFKDAAKRVAVGFAAQMAASITASIGFGNIGMLLGNAQGLGSALAVSSGFGGGGALGLGALAGAGVGSLATTGAPAAPQIVGATGSVTGPFAVGGTLTALAPVIAAAATAAIAYSNRDVLHGGDLNLAGQALLSVPTFGASFLYNPLKDALGFSDESPAARDGRLREGFLDSLLGGNRNVNTVNGGFTLNPNSVNSSLSGVGPNDIGLANPLAFALAGGSGKAGSDLANIFAEAINDADNFNESLVNTQSLMQQLGLDAESTKASVTNLFLDGKVTYDEFASSYSTLDQLSQHNLQGIGAVDDAIGILTKNLDNPRNALNAVGLAFEELEELGITSAEQIAQYFNDRAQPELAAFFVDLKNQGKDTFEEIAEAPTETLQPILAAFNQYANSIGQTFGQTADQIREQQDGWKGVTDEIDRANKAAERYNRTVASAPKPPSDGGGGGGGATDDVGDEPVPSGRVIRVNRNRRLNPNA